MINLAIGDLLREVALKVDVSIPSNYYLFLRIPSIIKMSSIVPFYTIKIKFYLNLVETSMMSLCKEFN